MKKFIIASIIGLAFLTGCGGQVDDSGNTRGHVEVGTIEVNGRQIDCIFYKSPGDSLYDINGIDCDWGSSNGVSVN